MGGYITVELTSAEPTALLYQLTKAGIALSDVGQIRNLTFRVTFDRTYLPQLRSVCKSNGATFRILHYAGIFRMIQQLFRRPIFVLGCLVILMLTIFLPTRILFVEVEGAGDIPVDLILSNANQCGVRLGADRSEIRSEKVKNELLEAIPELQWVGVNTYGCRIVISVRQRTVVEQEKPAQGISSLVAREDGIIREMTVLQGSATCKVGQSVTKGQVLISGYSDLGICLRGTHAQGEIYAQTQHTIEALTPSRVSLRAAQTREEKKYSVIFGNFRINFFKGSGISDGSCDKMYAYHYVTLPGGFRLPIALVSERTRWHDEVSAQMEQGDATMLLSDSSETYLNQQMLAGKIEHRYEIVTALDDAYYQIGKYACYEMIGVSRSEEDLTNHEIN